MVYLQIKSFKMIRINIILLIVSFVFFISCKKDEQKPLGEHPPLEHFSVNCNVTSYDSLGNIDANNIGITLTLQPVYVDQSHNGYIATTNTAGVAVFQNIVENSYIPNINLLGYDCAPLLFKSGGPSSTVNVNLPFAKQSPYKMDTLIGQNFNKDSITLTFNLSKSIPAGKFVKLAVITGTNNGLNPNDFVSVDIVNLTSPNVVKLNVAKLPNFLAAVNGLATNTNFYVNAIPVTYGSYYSNILYKSVLLGDNLFYKNNLIFLKNW